MLSFETSEYAERLRNILPSVEMAVPVKSIVKTIRFVDREFQNSVLGTVPWYTKSVNLVIERGRFISALDLQRYDNVCVLGKRLARQLFRFSDPMGQMVRVGRSLYKVIGKIGHAEKMFTRAVQIRPECVEAMRELRLINLRREKGRGLIKRLLRR